MNNELEYRVRKKNGIPHCDDGPAITLTDGTKKWYRYGKLHRIDGPAIELADTYRMWVDGKDVTTRYAWFIYGTNYTMDEFLKNADISDEEKLIIKLKYG